MVLPQKRSLLYRTSSLYPLLWPIVPGSTAHSGYPAPSILVVVTMLESKSLRITSNCPMLD